MTKQQIKVNNEINQFLKQSLELEEQLKDQPELITQIRRTSSLVAEFTLMVHGIPEALREFWNDKKALSSQNLI
jgi:hypothetical protein